MNPAVDNAKQFIVSRIVNQARADGIALSEAEKRMLSFVEASASPKDLEMAASFETETDDEQYETKIAELLKKVYEQDVERGDKETWDRSLDDLADEDLYLHVMLEKAGLVKTTTFLVMPDWRLLVAVAPMLVCFLLALGVAFLPWAARLIPNNLLRLGICIVLLAVPLAVNKLRKPAA